MSLIAACLTLTGCNEDKAKALYTAAKNFEAEATKAIDSIAAIYQFDAQPLNNDKAALEKELVEGTEGAFKGNSLNTEAFRAFLNSAVDRQATQVANDAAFAKLKVPYQAFSSNLAALPEAYILGASHVPCVAELGAKTVVDMVAFEKVVSANLKIDYRRRIELMSGVIAALRANDAAQHKVLVSKLLALEEERKQLTATAIKQISVAATVGADAITLAEKYNSVSAADALVVVNKALEIAGQSFKMDVEEAKVQLAVVNQKTKTDPIWKRVSQLQLGEVPSECGKKA